MTVWRDTDLIGLGGSFDPDADLAVHDDQLAASDRSDDFTPSEAFERASLSLVLPVARQPRIVREDPRGASPRGGRQPKISHGAPGEHDDRPEQGLLPPLAAVVNGPAHGPGAYHPGAGSAIPEHVSRRYRREHTDEMAARRALYPTTERTVIPLGSRRNPNSKTAAPPVDPGNAA
jgi:hypothetical protein